MRDYEVMTIHRPDLAEDEVETKIADLESHLSGSGATVDGRDMWGKRRFAYEIDHLSEGYYSVVTFQAEAAAVDSNAVAGRRSGSTQDRAPGRMTGICPRATA